MSNRSHRQAERTKRILQMLREKDALTLEELCQQLDASVATIRRDLLQMEAHGFLRRTRGGAVPIEPLFYEPFRKDSSFQDLVERSAAEKRRIGRAAAQLVVAGSVIVLTPGTTTNEVVRNLARDSNIRVITNAVNVAMELSKRRDVDVFVTGGHLRGDWFSLVGAGAAENLRKIFVDIAFLGANGVDSIGGLTCENPEEAELNGLMVRQATKRVAVADHTKLGRKAAWQLCPIRDIDLLITDSGATKSQLAAFTSLGIPVHVV